jgi:exosortase/archaeosortase family protein
MLLRVQGFFRHGKRKHRPQRREVSPLRSGFQYVWGPVKRHRIIVRSCLIFVVCISLGIFLYSRLVDSGALDGFQGFVASATGFFLNLFGGGVTVSGNSVSSSAWSMNIVTECTAIVPMIILLSAILAYPSPIRDKAIGIPLGLVALFVLNLVRTFSLFHIGSAFPSFLDTAHFLVWQSVMILAALIFWILQMEKLVLAGAR